MKDVPQGMAKGVTIAPAGVVPSCAAEVERGRNHIEVKLSRMQDYHEFEVKSLKAMRRVSLQCWCSYTEVISLAKSDSLAEQLKS